MLTKEQKELLKQFQSSVDGGGKKHSPQKSSWFEAVKSFFE